MGELGELGELDWANWGKQYPSCGRTYILHEAWHKVISRVSDVLGTVHTHASSNASSHASQALAPM
jgi:hypothetical protein